MSVLPSGSSDALAVIAGSAWIDQEDRDAGEEAEDRHARDDGEVGEDPVAAPALAAAGGGEELAGVGCRVDRAQVCYCSCAGVVASGALITPLIGTSQSSEIFSFRLRPIGRSLRQTIASGWRPSERSSFTECCVGFVLISPEGPM